MWITWIKMLPSECFHSSIFNIASGSQYKPRSLRQTCFTHQNLKRTELFVGGILFLQTPSRSLPCLGPRVCSSSSHSFSQSTLLCVLLPYRYNNSPMGVQSKLDQPPFEIPPPINMTQLQPILSKGGP